MAILTPFGELEFGDTSGLNEWVDAHFQRHTTYKRVAAQLGFPLQETLLMPPVNEDWFGRHLLGHIALERVFNPTNLQPDAGLVGADWNIAAQFYDWHQAHNLIHQRIDNALGITGN